MIPRDQDDQVARIAGKKAGEKPLGFIAASLTSKCLAQRRQNDNVVAAELDGFCEVGLGASDLVELELDQRAIDQGLGKAGLDLSRFVVGVQRADQAAGLGEGQASVEVHPGELRSAHRADGEVTRRFQKPALGVVAVPQEKPGPERCGIELMGLPQGLFGAGKIAVGQEGAAEQGEVVARCRDDACRELAIRLGQLGFSKAGVVQGALGVKGAGDSRRNLHRSVEARKRLLVGRADVTFRAELGRQHDRAASVQHDELRGLFP